MARQRAGGACPPAVRQSPEKRMTIGVRSDATSWFRVQGQGFPLKSNTLNYLVYPLGRSLNQPGSGFRVRVWD